MIFRRNEESARNNGDWNEIAELSAAIDEVFRQATKRLSMSARPLVADVIPVIDLINNRLEKLVNDMTKPPIVRASAAKGRAVLNKYYSKTDDSKMYRICMILR
ncbi:hypothetical protein F5878DRAFT_69850 [Lentinula raphanica]|uniref:Uncharacterized protein n=1 Tax=Lentinula raphanica TaxID=153919 RepID=A0AA38NVT8_9AGAR|nr:hypothetical protein F5878DRAFT_69850 [Lentinula raphanica]